MSQHKLIAWLLLLTQCSTFIASDFASKYGQVYGVRPRKTKPGAASAFDLVNYIRTNCALPDPSAFIGDLCTFIVFFYTVCCLWITSAEYIS